MNDRCIRCKDNNIRTQNDDYEKAFCVCRVNCARCGNKTTILEAEFPENCDELCDCGRPYLVKQIWSPHHCFKNKTYCRYWLCDACSGLYAKFREKRFCEYFDEFLKFKVEEE